MESIDRDPVEFCKILEKECNNRIHAYTNSLKYIVVFGKSLDIHLDQVMFHRKVINKWLTQLDIPNKDEIAALAIRKIDCESKLDHFDEIIYWTNQMEKKNRIKLKKVRESLEELLSVLQDGEMTSNNSKIQMLECDLLDLKFFFRQNR